MKIIPFFLIFFTTVLLHSQQPMNLTLAKNAVSDYYTSGKYDAEVDSVVNEAIFRLHQITVKPGDAAVFDVDETALSNLPHIMSLDFGFDFSMWNKWVMDGKSKAIPQVRRLYDTLVAYGVRIVFLTGRTDEYFPSTKANLTATGYVLFDTLITKNESYKQTSMAEYKEKTRCALESTGRHIIMCIGDQLSDLHGSCTGIKVKIPNYIYIME